MISYFISDTWLFQWNFANLQWMIRNNEKIPDFYLYMNMFNMHVRWYLSQIPVDSNCQVEFCYFNIDWSFFNTNVILKVL